MTAQKTEALFSDIEQFIAESRAMLDAGAMLEMAGLDDQVRSLCETVLQLSQDERITYSDRMQHLLAELKNLGESMVETREKLAEDIRRASTQKNATKAYKIADSRDNFGHREDDGDAQ